MGEPRSESAPTRELTAAVVAGVLAVSIAAGLSAANEPPARLTPSPAGPGSGMYGLTNAPDGTPYLSWLEPVVEGTHALKFSRLDKDTWTPAREIARSDNWFVNWADHPTFAVLSNGSLVAHWLANNGDKKGSYGYGFRIALSKDAGRTWREVYAGGTDNIEGYSGFVSLLPTREGFEAIFLGPPQGHSQHAESDPEHTMQLGALRFDLKGALKGSVVADANTCSCCSTSIVQTSRGPLAAYRDRADGEIRDISVVRLQQGAWTSPRTIANDGWHINACPTNGPSLSARGARVAVSWFTGAGGTPRVKAAFSTDAGDRFTTPVVIDEGRPVGWPATALLDDGSAVVSWLESRGNGKGELLVRRISPDGRLGKPVRVAESSSGRSTGIPQMIRVRDQLLLAWRTDRVLTALVPVPGY